MDVPYNQSFESERADMRERAAFVELHERVADQYPPRFPSDVDRAHLSYNTPTFVTRQVDVTALNDQLFGSFNNHIDDIKIRYANTPGPNHVKFNIARANGHVSGGVGMTGRYIPDEINEELGGGYAFKYSK